MNAPTPESHLGRTIRATGNHQFLTIQGWRRLDTIPEGMRIAVPRERLRTNETCPQPIVLRARVNDAAQRGHRSAEILRFAQDDTLPANKKRPPPRSGTKGVWPPRYHPG